MFILRGGEVYKKSGKTGMAGKNIGKSNENYLPLLPHPSTQILIA